MSIEEIVKRKRAGANAEAAAEPKPALLTVRRQRPLVGGLAQVSLLPQELRTADRRRGLRRRLVGGVVLTAVVVGAGVAASAALAVSSSATLAAETAKSADLARQMQKYAAVQQLEQGLALGQAAVRVGSSTAVDWDPQIDRIKSQIPKGFTITAIATDAATPVQDYTQGTTPLEAARAATVTITARSSAITALPGWISAVQALPETADATPVVTSGDKGKFTVVLTVHLTDKAFITPLKTGTAK